MTFVSYAQNYEDVMLWRALQRVEKGFYIDVGANDPDIDSVTKAFYERGWRGINIEPLVSHWQDLQRERPQDVNLQCAAGDARGELNLWEADVRGWATLSPSVVAKHQREGYQGRSYKVPVLTLTEICNSHALGDIHFLKIDVEGFEQSVLTGMDFGRFRPWIVVVEATEPNSVVENYDQWESLLLTHGYRFVYADGLNRYYLADEHADLVQAFKYPPNVFDDFKPATQLRAEVTAHTQLGQLEQSEAELQASRAEVLAVQEEVRAARAETQALSDDMQELRVVADAAQEQCRAMRESTSWRVTAPLRWAGDAIRGHVLPIGKRVIKRLLQQAAQFVNRRPGLKRAVMRVFDRFPRLRHRLARIVNQSFIVSHQRIDDAVFGGGAGNLTPRARQVYTDLKAAIARDSSTGRVR